MILLPIEHAGMEGSKSISDNGRWCCGTTAVVSWCRGELFASVSDADDIVKHDGCILAVSRNDELVMISIDNVWKMGILGLDERDMSWLGRDESGILAIEEKEMMASAVETIAHVLLENHIHPR